MELVKKNIVLFVVLGVAFLVSVVFVFFVFQVSMKMKTHREALLVQRDKIKKLIEEKPAPLRGNLDAINLDVGQFQMKVQEIHQIFGRPYRSAIQAFAAVLEVSEYTLYSKWRSAYEKEKRTGTAEQIFLKFTGEYDGQKIDSAISAFKTTIEKRTLEDLNNNAVVDQLIMEGLGLPRKMSAEACKTYMSNMDLSLNNLLGAKDVGLGRLITVSEKNSIFNIYGDNMPLPEHIGLIPKHYSMLEDLVYRMKATGIKGINSLAKVNLEGTESRGFLRLSYKMQIVGSMDSIRDLINNFQDAYKDNRIYIVRDLALKKAVDETKSVVGPVPIVEKKSPTSEKGRKEKGDDSYGAAVIGSSTDVFADIKIDYVIYVADEIRRK
ncbi:MAG: hypothetical protein WCS96_00705 [Victivallales bacterium]